MSGTIERDKDHLVKEQIISITYSNVGTLSFPYLDPNENKKYLSHLRMHTVVYLYLEKAKTMSANF